MLEGRLWDDEKLIAKIESDDTTFLEPQTIYKSGYLSIIGPETVSYIVFANPAKDD
jgi:hypothetical protein